MGHPTLAALPPSREDLQHAPENVCATPCGALLLDELLRRLHHHVLVFWRVEVRVRRVACEPCQATLQHHVVYQPRQVVACRWCEQVVAPLEPLELLADVARTAIELLGGLIPLPGLLPAGTQENRISSLAGWDDLVALEVEEPLQLQLLARNDARIVIAQRAWTFVQIDRQLLVEVRGGILILIFADTTNVEVDGCYCTCLGLRDRDVRCAAVALVLATFRAQARCASLGSSQLQVCLPLPILPHGSWCTHLRHWRVGRRLVRRCPLLAARLLSALRRHRCYRNFSRCAPRALPSIIRLALLSIWFG